MFTNRCIATAALSIALAACAGGTADTSATTAQTEATATATTVPTPTPTTTPTSQPPASTSETPTSTNEATTTSGAGPADLRGLAGVATIDLVDPAPAGLHPTLAWDDVPGADHYRLVVVDDGGSPYWGWIGTDTSVAFGGATAGDGLTAAVHQPMTWTVAAIDADGRTIAISDRGTLPGEG